MSRQPGHAFLGVCGWHPQTRWIDCFLAGRKRVGLSRMTSLHRINQTASHSPGWGSAAALNSENLTKVIRPKKHDQPFPVLLVFSGHAVRRGAVVGIVVAET